MIVLRLSRSTPPNRHSHSLFIFSTFVLSFPPMKQYSSRASSRSLGKSAPHSLPSLPLSNTMNFGYTNSSHNA